MLRSLYSGISGMKNFQLKLDVIGNNIANVNTYGYKKSRITFKDLVSQQIAGASAGTGELGGVNPKQIGLGASIGTVDTIHTTGATQTTSRTLDLAINGDGFFAVGTINDLSRVNLDIGANIGDNKIAGNINNAISLAYTRAGNFYLDEKGYLVTGDGMYVIGETGEKFIPGNQEITKANDALTAITSFNAPFENMLNAVKDLSKYANDLKGAMEAYEEAYKIWDDAGQPTSGPLVTAKNNAYTALNNLHSGLFTTSLNSFNTEQGNFNTAVSNLNTAIKKFNTTNPVTEIITQITNSITNQTDPTIPNSNTTAPTTTHYSNLTSLINTLDSYLVDLDNMAQSVIKFEDVAESLKEPSWSESLSGVAGLIQIPLTAKSFSIGPDGTVSFVDKKGQLKVAGQLRLANFPNEGGLEKIGGNLFKESSNSGSVDKDGNGVQLEELFAPGSDGAGTLTTGALEMSNVDLSEEFTEMIVAQRGFQSNTKIITTSDEILQELMSLKR